jgi:hypothetical protein
MYEREWRDSVREEEREREGGMGGERVRMIARGRWEIKGKGCR